MDELTADQKERLRLLQELLGDRKEEVPAQSSRAYLVSVAIAMTQLATAHNALQMARMNMPDRVADELIPMELPDYLEQLVSGLAKQLMKGLRADD